MRTGSDEFKPAIRQVIKRLDPFQLLFHLIEWLALLISHRLGGAHFPYLSEILMTKITPQLEGLLRWMEPGEFLNLCLSNTDVQWQLEQLGTLDGDTALMSDALGTLFDEEYLVQIIDRFEESKDRIVEWLLENGRKETKKRGGHPKKRLKWPPGKPNLKYQWLCKDCGPTKLHMYPVQSCCSCGGQNLVRQITKDTLGWRYDRERITLG